MDDDFHYDSDCCEDCDEPIGPEGHETADGVWLCGPCYEAIASDPMNHADECECEECK